MPLWSALVRPKLSGVMATAEPVFLPLLTVFFFSCIFLLQRCLHDNLVMCAQAPSSPFSPPFWCVVCEHSIVNVYYCITC